MIEFTPEQKAEVARQVSEAKDEAHKIYDAQAHKFRELIKRHPVPAANTIGWICLLLGCALGWYAHSFTSMVGWK
jgi:hypothetical protein